MSDAMPDLRAFRVFVAVAETGGIKPAAERLGRTPSAVSMTLKALEEELGAPLFQQERKTQLTTFGLLVLDEAREVIAHHASTCATLKSFARNQTGRCDVGSVTSVALAFLPRAVRRLRQRLPDFGVQIRQMESQGAPNAILEGTLDIAFAARLNLPEDVVFEPLFSDALDVVCAADDPLARIEGPVSWEAIGDRPFIYNDSFHSVHTPELNAIAERASMRVSSVFGLMAAIREGLGVSVLPRLCKVHGAEGLAFLPTDDRNAVRVVGMLSKRGRRQLPGTVALAAAVKAVIRERAAELRYELLVEDDAPALPVRELPAG
mgnify:CR=1 FL=1